MEWRTIDSAPKDGASVLVSVREIVGEAYYRQPNYRDDPDEGWWWANTGAGDYYAEKLGTSCGDPDHWMQLPAPPGADQGIPMHPTALVEKGIPGLATIPDATDDVLGKDGE